MRLEAGVEQITTQQVVFLGILLVAIALLVSERLRPDVVALLIILALAYTHLLSSSDAFSGLSSEPAIVIACMFVLSAGLQTTGVSELLGRFIGNLAGHYLIGLPLIILLAFTLDMGAPGMWFGLSAGLTATAAFLVLRILQQTRSTSRTQP